MKVIAALAAAAALTIPAQAAERPPLAVDASVSPASVLFGDPADVAVEVLVNDDRVNPATVSLEADAEPLARVGRVHRDAWKSGGLVLHCEGLWAREELPTSPRSRVIGFAFSASS